MIRKIKGHTFIPHTLIFDISITNESKIFLMAILSHDIGECITIKFIMEELNWTREKIDQCLNNLIEKGFVRLASRKFGDGDDVFECSSYALPIFTTQRNHYDQLYYFVDC